MVPLAGRCRNRWGPTSDNIFSVIPHSERKMLTLMGGDFLLQRTLDTSVASRFGDHRLMIRRIVFVVVLVSVVARENQAQDAGKRYDFRPTAKAGDRFLTTNETRQTMQAATGGKTLISTEQTDSRSIESTVEAANRDGKPLDYREKTTRHDRNRKMDSSVSLTPAQSNVGPLQDVELEYQFTNGRYEPSLRSGEPSQELDIKLKSPRISVLDEEFLPTVPLAVGESQTVADQKRLKEIFHEFGPETTFLQPLKITLSSVQKIKGTNYAMLRESVKLKTLLPIETGAEVAVVLDVEMTVAYDLDRQYLRQAKVRSSGDGKMSVASQSFDIKLTYSADTYTLKRGPAVDTEEEP